MRYDYWLFYETLDFAAHIVRAPQGEGPNDDSRHYDGPYSTLKEARAIGIKKARQDINEIRGMILDLKRPPIDNSGWQK